eukprot:scaffold39791_cov60-Phaeocystis_antarctica.AAC.5
MLRSTGAAVEGRLPSRVGSRRNSSTWYIGLQSRSHTVAGAIKYGCRLRHIGLQRWGRGAAAPPARAPVRSPRVACRRAAQICPRSRRDRGQRAVGSSVGVGGRGNGGAHGTCPPARRADEVRAWRGA